MFDALLKAKRFAVFPRPQCALCVSPPAFDPGKNDSMAGQILPGNEH